MTLTESLLWPVSVVYGTAGWRRARSYRAGILRRRRLNGIVVSVGNITTGGTGKTPMVLWVAQRFLEIGKKVGVLSRGYRPLPEQPGVGGDAGAQGWNDEVALLHGRLGERVELGTGAERYEKGRELEKRGIDCFVLDDGFQYLQLARDVDVVMIDAANPFGGGHVLPSGRLREPISALRRADIVVIHRTEERVPAIEAVVRRYTAAPIYFSQTKLLGLEAHRRGEVAAAFAQGRKFFAFCGIGNPSAFFADLKNWGVAVIGRDSFRDHHRYTEHDMLRLEEQAAAAGADALICTEKDVYDLPRDATTHVPIIFCRIGLQFNDEEGLWRSIVQVIASRKSGRMA
ncbi:MAG: tetraacyldisaccharide 4'-kinase [Candidatus Acidiferrales bacterium]